MNAVVSYKVEATLVKAAICGGRRRWPLDNVRYTMRAPPKKGENGHNTFLSSFILYTRYASFTNTFVLLNHIKIVGRNDTLK